MSADAGAVPELTPGADERQLRAVFREFLSGITVVTTVAHGRRHAMTANAFCSVSLAPPQVLVCVADTARFHAAIEESGLWGVSILADDQDLLATRFAAQGRDLETQFDGVDHLPGAATAAPLLAGAQAWLECRTVQSVIAGDHTIVVGEVLASGVNPDALAPLAYHRGRYASPWSAGATQPPTDVLPRTRIQRDQRGAL